MSEAQVTWQRRLLYWVRMVTVDSYLARLAPREQGELERIRQIVKAAVPEAEEVLSYGMPGFTYQGKYLLGYAAFKDHLSLFPTAAPITALKHKLESYKLAKGTIQFTPDKPVPETVLRELLNVRITAILDQS